MNIEDIPNEIFKNEIIPWMEIDEFLNLCVVSKKFRTICNDNKIWEKILKVKYQNLNPEIKDYKNYALTHVIKGTSVYNLAKILYNVFKQRKINYIPKYKRAYIIEDQVYLCDDIKQVMYDNFKAFYHVFMEFILDKIESELDEDIDEFLFPKEPWHINILLNKILKYSDRTWAMYIISIDFPVPDHVYSYMNDIYLTNDIDYYLDNVEDYYKDVIGFNPYLHPMYFRLEYGDWIEKMRSTKKVYFNRLTEDLFHDGKLPEELKRVPVIYKHPLFIDALSNNQLRENLIV